MGAIASAVIGAGASIFGANTAAKAQKDAAAMQIQYQYQALQTQKDLYTQNRQIAQAAEQPFIDVGTNAATQYNSMLPQLTSTINPDQATLENMPGYQFTKTQGLQAVDNSTSARFGDIAWARCDQASFGYINHD